MPRLIQCVRFVRFLQDERGEDLFGLAVARFKMQDEPEQHLGIAMPGRERQGLPAGVPPPAAALP